MFFRICLTRQADINSVAAWPLWRPPKAFCNFQHCTLMTESCQRHQTFSHLAAVTVGSAATVSLPATCAANKPVEVLMFFSPRLCDGGS